MRPATPRKHCGHFQPLSIVPGRRHEFGAAWRSTCATNADQALVDQARASYCFLRSAMRASRRNAMHTQQDLSP